MNLNDRISKILEESNFTSSEFADEIDVQRSSISHITSGRNKPSLEFITKIKARFPDLSWDWLINGEGEMRKSVEEEIIQEEEQKKQPNKQIPLPDLFSLIDDDQFGITESEDRVSKPDLRESPISHKDVSQSKIEDSQRLGNQEKASTSKLIDNEEVTLKRIVMFYSNGKFESFDQ